MFIFGHRFLQSEDFYHIQSVEAIQHTPPSSTLYIEFSEENLDIITYMQENQLPFALYVESVTQLIYANILGCRYIVLKKHLAKTAQNIATTYLFDPKILVIIESEVEIEEFALLGIDGVVFSNAIIKTNS